MTGGAIRTFMIADVRGYTSYTQTYGDEAVADFPDEAMNRRPPRSSISTPAKQHPE